KNCLPQVRKARMGCPTRRVVSMAQVLPSARTMVWPTKRAVCSFRIYSDGPSGTAFLLRCHCAAEEPVAGVRGLTFHDKDRLEPGGHRHQMRRIFLPGGWIGRKDKTIKTLMQKTALAGLFVL